MILQIVGLCAYMGYIYFILGLSNNDNIDNDVYNNVNSFAMIY